MLNKGKKKEKTLKVFPSFSSHKKKNWGEKRVGFLICSLKHLPLFLREISMQSTDETWPSQIHTGWEKRCHQEAYGEQCLRCQIISQSCARDIGFLLEHVSSTLSLNHMAAVSTCQGERISVWYLAFPVLPSHPQIYTEAQRTVYLL